MAVKALRTGDVHKIILTRPVVEVGNSIGYLPGDIDDKVGPYLIPLFDELAYYVQKKHVTKLMAEGKIEICPLSMMRGRTFVDTFVILDEAQNAQKGELRMFLTRIGANSRQVLTGDLLQSDLPGHVQGGFAECLDKLEGIDGLDVLSLTKDDIVRHPIISEIERRLK
jgi:phosphate starvation-inducible PhoH-like protein